MPKPHILHSKDLGSVSAYGDALTGGFVGTKEQFMNVLLGISGGALFMNVGSRKVTLTAANWSNGQYSLASVLSPSRYNILSIDIDGNYVREGGLPGGEAYNAFVAADIYVGSGNVLYANGTTPQVDIDVDISYESRTGTIDALPVAESTYYTGQTVTPTWTGFNPSELDISGQTTGTAIGTYTVSFTPKQGFKWWDNTTAAKQTTWSIVAFPSWSTATDAEVISLLERHYAGEIDLHDYWDVGEERVIHMNSINISGYEQNACDLTFVLLHKGGVTLADGVTECAFAVGTKEILPESMGSEKRTTFRNYFKNALPSSIVGIFKDHLSVRKQSNGTAQTTTLTFELPSVYEVVALSGYEIEGIQFDYYKTQSNRQKKRAGSSSTTNMQYWTRSTLANGNQYYIYGNGSGAGNTTYYTSMGYSMHGVI